LKLIAVDDTVETNVLGFRGNNLSAYQADDKLSDKKD
jgi:hypothetical protein